MKFGYPLGTEENPGDIGVLEQLLEAKSVGLKPEDSLHGTDLLVLLGGEDISPSWYDEKPVYTSAPVQPSQRDLTEVVMFLDATENNIPVLAICRGAQFACALLGGSLWQDVKGHNGADHDLIYNGVRYATNSYHHQMMRPTKEMEILAYSPCRSRIKCSERPITDEGDEPEIVFHREKRVLMIQGHPEWCLKSEDLYQLTRQLVGRLLWS